MNLTPIGYLQVSTEAMAVLVNLILLYGNMFETQKKTVHGNMYSWMVFTNIVALTADGFSWVLEGPNASRFLLILCNTVSIIAALVLIADFVLYLTTYISQRVRLRKTAVRFVLIFLSGDIAVTTVLCLTGSMFSIQNGVYEIGPLYGLYSTLIAIGMIATIGLVFKYRKELGRHDCTAAVVYIAIPTFSAFINLFLQDEISFTYQATTLSAMILYVMIQSEQGSKLVEEKNISNYYASHDALTGLFNRREYISKLDRLKNSDKGVGVVFSDLNGLKYVNDRIGHEAGDRLILRFTAMLAECFRSEDICRISGDEFVVIAENISKNVFDERVKKLESVITVNGRSIACAGVGYGPGKDAVTLIRDAESEMYIRKEEYHKKHPELQRT